MKKQILALSLTGFMAFGALFSINTIPAHAVGNGPNYNGHESVQTERLHNYEEMVQFLKQVDERSEAMNLEVIGQSVKGRDLYLAKFISNPKNPTILFLTQQHGNEALTTEGALQFIKYLGSNSKEVKEMLDKVNVLVLPRLNVDGAEGDVNFSLENYAEGEHTRYNANNVDLNRDHVDRTQPETKALHENVLKKYKIDYMIDLHHQGAQSTLGDSDELVSGAILYPTNENVDPKVIAESRKLGAVVYHAVEARGFGTLAKYVGGSDADISRNEVALEYGIPTLLFEMRGMSDHYREDYILGQKSNGYIIKQAVITMDATVKAIADGSIQTADDSFWDTLPEDGHGSGEEEA
ncbi:M14 family metallopeptidase [Peribacillus butanolivorans]|uniref:M14 family metallopeptidase n=1 Tax=Peribacillus butanolivorans TaxID=421767 RepID=UPI00366C6A39